MLAAVRPPAPTVVLCFLAVAFGAAASAGEAAPPVRINEIQAANLGPLADRDGDYSDWIELHNPGPGLIDLTGFYLTDDPENPARWRIPSGMLEPGGFLVVFASGKDRGTIFDRELHTNFRLALAGEYLAVVLPDGITVADAFSPGYPPQQPGIAYGYPGDVEPPAHLAQPTPAAPNAAALSGVVEQPEFSAPAGLPDEAFAVELHCATPDAAIYYTTDGREPGPGNIFTGPVGSLYDSGTPIAISTTTILRARAFHDPWRPSTVATRSWLFPHDVVRQPADPPGYPRTWPGADYGMDQDPAHLPLIAGDAALTPAAALERIAVALRALPSLSLVLPVNGLFSPAEGIYHHTNLQGMSSERRASAELIFPDRREGFQIDCGLRIQGFTSRDPLRNPKHSLRLAFREDYGAASLRFPLFGPDAARQFKTLVLRSNSQDAWVYDADSNRAGQFIRDEWNRRVQRALGQPAAHGCWVHLYLNGLYWGVYNPTERPDADFLASYLGGSAGDYDVVKNHEEIIEGNNAAYRSLLTAVQRNPDSFTAGYLDFSDSKDWLRIQGLDSEGKPDPEGADLLETANLADYIIHNVYSAATDWPGNFYMGRNRNGAHGGFRFFSWDNEHGLKHEVTINRALTHSRDADSPTKFHHPLRSSPDYRLLFADRLHRAFFNGGPLAVDPASPGWDPARPDLNRPAALWVKLTEEIEEALAAESARWGDYRRAVPYTVSRDFSFLRDLLLQNWFPGRSAIVLEQFRQQGLYPDLEAPVFSRPGGWVSAGTPISLRSRHAAGIFVPNGGAIYYTVNGPDPRLGDGSLDPRSSAVPFGPVTLDGTGPQTYRARLFRDGVWSALSEVTYHVDHLPADSSNLVLSELHYHPAGPAPQESAAGFQDAEDFEFLELHNTGSVPVDLAGLRFTEGIRYDFPLESPVLLAPGACLVLAQNAAAFAARYGSGIAHGVFSSGRLSNDGERLRLEAAGGNAIFDFAYGATAPWPLAADGEGPSLVLITPNPETDPSIPLNWSASPLRGGSPGRLEHSGEDPFEIWMQRHGFSDPLADPDGDGLPHLFSYAMGIDVSPQDARTPAWSILQEPGGPVFRHRERLDLGNVSVRVEASADLIEWAPVSIEPERLDNGDGTQTLVHRLPRSDQTAFLRLTIRRVREMR
ncbi:MAG TPA: lamin tail domain-containing protein [Verrucomicrobiales bacterium]|nr:lamin tail domain-containing protein [Verrucomicrobiales bacterium]